ncbi:hypothetical protein MNEG_14904, partial [Monoraphidium neglectum]
MLMGLATKLAAACGMAPAGPGPSPSAPLMPQHEHGSYPPSGGADLYANGSSHAVLQQQQQRGYTPYPPQQQQQQPRYPAVPGQQGAGQQAPYAAYAAMPAPFARPGGAQAAQGILARLQRIVQ